MPQYEAIQAIGLEMQAKLDAAQNQAELDAINSDDDVGHAAFHITVPAELGDELPSDIREEALTQNQVVFRHLAREQHCLETLEMLEKTLIDLFNSPKRPSDVHDDATREAFLAPIMENLQNYFDAVSEAQAEIVLNRQDEEPPEAYRVAAKLKAARTKFISTPGLQTMIDNPHYDRFEQAYVAYMSYFDKHFRG